MISQPNSFKNCTTRANAQHACSHGGQAVATDTRLVELLPYNSAHNRRVRENPLENAAIQRFHALHCVNFIDCKLFRSFLQVETFQELHHRIVALLDLLFNTGLQMPHITRMSCMHRRQAFR